MITLKNLEKIVSDFKGLRLSDLERNLGFELNESQCSTGEDTPDGLEDMYYYIKVIDKDGDNIDVTLFVTFYAECSLEENDGVQYKVPINSESWSIQTIRILLD